MSANGKGNVVVVTGASAGVGRAVVRELAQSGAHIGLLARGRVGLEATAEDVRRLGGQALILQADVADAQAVDDAAALVEDTFGPIDVWINNAMTSVFSPVKKLTAAEIKRVTEVTYLGYVHGTLSSLTRMLQRNRGTIVQVGSALAYRAIPLQAAYCAAKHAIEGFTESLRTELLHDRSNVQITTVHLPAVNTPQFNWVKSKLPNEAQPVPPIYQPELAARAIVWAVRNPKRRQLSVGMSTVVAIQGNKLFPGIGDRYLAHSGYSSQQTSTPKDAHQPDNLWQPVEGDFGAHGAFDDRARTRSLQLWLAMHSRRIAGLATGCLAVLGASYALRSLVWSKVD